MPTLDQFIVWIIIGLIGGSLSARLIRWDARGYGWFWNLALGLAGAFVGGLLFRLAGILPDLDRIAVSLRDIVAAIVGSLIVLAAVWGYQRWQRGRGDG
jgi:uncharacterized membrane protein YeaQ/YmgE (transglycosylase-associated protein family)